MYSLLLCKIILFILYICRSSINNHTFSLKADIIEPLIIEGMYKVQGKVIILPIKGDGKSNLTLGM